MKPALEIIPIPNDEVIDLLSDDESNENVSKNNNQTVIGDADSTQGSQNETDKAYDALQGAKRDSVDLTIDDDSTDNNDEVHSSTKEEQQPYSIAFKHLAVRDSMLTNEKLANTFKCAGKFCTFTSKDAENFCIHIQKHLRNSHSDDDFMKCSYCVFKPKERNAVDLLTHVYSEHGHCQFSCPSCFFVAASKSVVQVHRAEAHAEDSDAPIIKFVPANEDPDACARGVLPQKVAVQKYECPVGTNPRDLEHSVACGFKAYKAKSLVQHITRTHRHEQDYSCGVQDCNQRFKSIGELVKHQEQHEMCEYQCAYCVKGEVGETEMLVHFARVHPEKAPKAYCRYLIEEVSHEATKDESGIMLLDNDLAPATFVGAAHESIADQEAVRAHKLETLLHRTSSSSASTAKYNMPKSVIKTEPDLNEPDKTSDSDKFTSFASAISLKSETRHSDDSASVTIYCHSSKLSPGKQTIDMNKDNQRSKNNIPHKVVSHFFNNTPPTTLTQSTKKLLPRSSFSDQTQQILSGNRTEKHTEEPTQTALEIIPVVRPSEPSSKYRNAALISQQDNTVPREKENYVGKSASVATFKKPVVKRNDTKLTSDYKNGPSTIDQLDNTSLIEKQKSSHSIPPSIASTIPSFIDSNQRYMCGSLDCTVIFDCFLSLRNHMISSHVAERRFQCNVCKKSMEINFVKQKWLTLKAYLLHVRMHGEKLYLCRICNYVHFLNRAIRRHMTKHENANADTNIILVRDIQIAESTSNATIKAAYNYPNAQSDHQVNLTCTICNYVGNKSMMMRHISEKHPEQNYNNTGSRNELQNQPILSDLARLQQCHLQVKNSLKSNDQSQVLNNHISMFNTIYKPSGGNSVIEENHDHSNKHYNTNLTINCQNNIDHSSNKEKINESSLSASRAPDSHKNIIDWLVDSLVCPFCPGNRKLANGKSFVHHIAVHYSMKGFICGHCKYAESITGVYLHQKKYHYDKPRLVLINNDLEVLPLNSVAWLRLLKKYSWCPKLRRKKSCDPPPCNEMKQASETQKQKDAIKSETYIEIEISSEIIPINAGSTDSENVPKSAKVIEPMQISEHHSEEEAISSTEVIPESVQSINDNIGANEACDEHDIIQIGERANVVQSVKSLTNRTQGDKQTIPKVFPFPSASQLINDDIGANEACDEHAIIQIGERANVVQSIKSLTNRTQGDKQTIPKDFPISSASQLINDDIGANEACDEHDIIQIGERANVVQSIKSHTNRTPGDKQTIEKDFPTPSTSSVVPKSLISDRAEVNTNNNENIDKKRRTSFREDASKVSEEHSLSKRQKKAVTFDLEHHTNKSDDMTTILTESSAVINKNTNKSQQNLQEPPTSVKIRKCVAKKSTSKLPISIESIKYNAKYGLAYLRKHISTNTSRNDI